MIEPVSYIRWRRAAQRRWTAYHVFRQAPNGKVEANPLCGAGADWDTAQEAGGGAGAVHLCKRCLRSLARRARYGG